MASRARTTRVFIFDFDHTMVDANSDIEPFKALCPDVLEQEVLHSKLAWHDRINNALARLPERRISPAAFLAAVGALPLPESIRVAIEAIRADPAAVAAVVSDANTLFIQAVLRANALGDAFRAGVYSNPAEVVSDHHTRPRADDETCRIAIRPFCSEDAPHACSACAANLCKGEVVERLLARYPAAQFAYIGDGSNDFCGCRRLGEDAVTLPRMGFGLCQILRREPIASQIWAWDSPDELRDAIHRLLGLYPPPP